MAAPAVSVSKSWTGPALQFSILKECSKSKCRTAKLTLPHHTLETPTFMPVGTKGTMKGLLPEQVTAAGADIILGNTYHLGTQPGKETMQKAGGLHEWMKWQRGLLTDSGGFQMVSLLKLAKITEDGVTFKSPYDGSECVLTPEESIRIQNAIGADIMMQLDDVVDVMETDYERFKEATLRTTRWLDRCIAANSNPETQNLFPIVQGGLFPDLRELSLQQLMERDSPGYAVGGLSGGEDKHQFWSTIHQCTDKLPLAKPRYSMGVGFAPDLVVCVALGIDMFDCVYPTRTARFGCALVDSGQLSVKSERLAHDFTPIDAACPCSTCAHYTRAYLHMAAKERAAVACHLLSVHNIAYQMRLMRRIRESVKEERFPEFVAEFLTAYYGDLQTVPDWIKDALAAVNITLPKSDCGDSGASGTDETTLRHPETERHLKMTTLHATEAEKKSLHIEGWDMEDEENDFKENSFRRTECALSGFETRAFDQGYREALRLDYPEEEERGRVNGFADAFRMVGRGRNTEAPVAGTVNSHAQSNYVGKPLNRTCSCKTDGKVSETKLEGGEMLHHSFEEKELADNAKLTGVGVESCAQALSAANISSTLGHETRSSSKENSALVQHPTFVLSALEGSLSLLLLRGQSSMSDDHLREVVSIRESIKTKLQKINESFDLTCENSVNLAFRNEVNCCNSVQGLEKSLSNDGCCKSAEHVPQNLISIPIISIHEHVESLLERSKSVSSYYQWNLPSHISC